VEQAPLYKITKKAVKSEISLASAPMIASAGIIFLLGSAHLLYTFHGTKLHPRDPALQTRMREVSPVITRETSMWNAWIGFNATHSCSAILFGLVWGYLALVHPYFLFNSHFLLGLGFVFLAFYVFLGKAYFFSIPFRGIVLASVLYVAAIGVNWA